MTNPRPADGSSLPDGLVAVIDEAGAEVGGGVHYLLASAVIIDPLGLAADVVTVVDGPTRLRGFHWRQEGPIARDRMLTLVETSSIVGHVHARATGRRGQVRARLDLLAGLVVVLAREGISHLVIESQGPLEDGRDRAVLLDTFREHGGVPFTYDWRTKAEPLLWIADAIGGAVRQHLIGEDSSPYERLCVMGVIHGVTYG